MAKRPRDDGAASAGIPDNDRRGDQSSTVTGGSWRVCLAGRTPSQQMGTASYLPFAGLTGVALLKAGEECTERDDLPWLLGMHGNEDLQQAKLTLNALKLPAEDGDKCHSPPSQEEQLEIQTLIEAIARSGRRQAARDVRVLQERLDEQNAGTLSLHRRSALSSARLRAVTAALCQSSQDARTIALLKRLARQLYPETRSTATSGGIPLTALKEVRRAHQPPHTAQAFAAVFAARLYMTDHDRWTTPHSPRTRNGRISGPLCIVLSSCWSLRWRTSSE